MFNSEPREYSLNFDGVRNRFIGLSKSAACPGLFRSYFGAVLIFYVEV